MSREELHHHYRVIDMMLTMHSSLRDVNKRKALLVDIILLISTAILVAVVFIDPIIVNFITITPEIFRIIIGGCSIIVFVISLIALRVDWKQKAERHKQACESLIKLKSKCRELLKIEKKADSIRIEGLCKDCSWILGSLPKIPEAQFHKLKLIHKRKIQLSKLIDNYPGSPLFILRLILSFQSSQKLVRDLKASRNRKQINE